MNDRGSVAPIAIFGIVFVLALSLVFSNATAVLQQQRFLQSVAEGMALDLGSQIQRDIPIDIQAADDLDQLMTLDTKLRQKLDQLHIKSATQSRNRVEITLCQPAMILHALQITPTFGEVCAAAAAKGG